MTVDGSRLIEKARIPRRRIPKIEHTQCGSDPRRSMEERRTSEAAETATTFGVAEKRQR